MVKARIKKTFGFLRILKNTYPAEFIRKKNVYDPFNFFLWKRKDKTRDKKILTHNRTLKTKNAYDPFKKSYVNTWIKQGQKMKIFDF